MKFLTGVMFAAALVMPVSAFAQDKPLKLVVPFAAGGPTDSLARHLAEGLKNRLNRVVIVDNKAGAGGNIGALEVARAEPDGSTILFGTSGPLAINLSLYKTLNYHPLDSFEPVIMIGALPNVLMVNPKVPAKNLKELVAYAKSKPGQLSYASSGNGASSHLAGVLFNNTLGTDIKHVPYRGTGPALTDLIAGHVEMTFTDVLTAAPHIKGGTGVAIGVTTVKRSSAMPDVPTLDEQGVKGFDVSVFFGIVAPKGTPESVIATLNRAFVESMAEPSLTKKLEGQGIIRESDTSPGHLTAVMKNEIAKWKDVVASSGAQLD